MPVTDIKTYVSWIAGVLASDYSGAYNDGDTLSADPAGFVGGTWVRNGITRYFDDIDGVSGKPCLEFAADSESPGFLSLTPTYSDTSILTAVVVGKVNNLLGADFVDGSAANRRLLDTDGSTWRAYTGSSVVSGGTADTDLHLFIMEYRASGNEVLEVDGVQVLNGEAGSNTNDGLVLGSSNNGEHNGSRIAFVGFIDRELTAQEKTDLLNWHQADAPLPTPVLTARGSGDGQVDLTWGAVPDAEGYRLYVDGVEDTGVGLLTGTAFTKTGLTTGQLYDFQLLAEKDSGATQSSLSIAQSERAAQVFTSVDAELYTGYNHTPLVDTPLGGQKAINWHDYSAFYSNARSDGQHFSWYLEGTDTPLYGYAHEWLDGATIAWRSGGACRIIEWNLGDDAWRQTDIAAPGETHTIDHSDITTNAGSGSVTAARFNNNLLEHAVQFQDNFEVWIWGASEPAAPPAPGPVTLTTTWRGVESDSADQSSYTFSAVDIGTDGDVLALVWLRSLSDLTGSSITVDGQTGTVVFARAVEDVGGGPWNWIAGVHVSGLTGPVDIVVTAAASSLRCAVAVWSVDGDPGTVSGDNVHADEQPGFVTDPGALLAAAYTSQPTTEFVKANAEGLTTRAQVEVEPTDNILNVADDLTDTGLTYLRWPDTNAPTAWGWTAWLTFNDREAAGSVQKMSVGGQTVVRAFDGTTEAVRVYSDGVLLLGTAP